jgi:hypothetical protein
MHIRAPRLTSWRPDRLPRAEPVANRRLALGQGVEITHADASMARPITRQGRATHCPQICARVQAFDLGRLVEQDSVRAVDSRERDLAPPLERKGLEKGVHGAMVTREMGSLERGRAGCDATGNYLGGSPQDRQAAYSRRATSPPVFRGLVYNRSPCTERKRSGCAEVRRPP